MKTTIELPDELMQEVKIRAAVEGRKLKDVFAGALRTGLAAAKIKDPSPQRIRVVPDSVTGLPTVSATADAPGSTMTYPQIKHLEENSQNTEDLQNAGISL